MIRATWLRLLLLSISLFILTSSIQCALAQPAPPTEEDKNLITRLVDAKTLIQGGKHQEAITQHIDPVITHFEERYRNSTVRAYSSDNLAATLSYLLQAANASAADQKSAAVYSGNWAAAYFLKGYALVELKQSAAALAALKSAVALSPLSAPYQSELGNHLASLKDLPAAMDTFKAAETAAREFSPKEAQTGDLGRALRGQAYVLIEMGQLNEAEKKYQECLQLDPKDQRALSQLTYIAQTREKQADTALMQTDASMKDFVYAWRLAEAQAIAPSVQDYVRRFGPGSFWNDQGTQQRTVTAADKAVDLCLTATFPAPEKARMVFITDNTGNVVQALTDQKGEVAECLTEKLRGHRIPPAPRSPFYACARFEKTGENSHALSTCGPRPFISTCQRDGASKRCAVKNG